MEKMTQSTIYVGMNDSETHTQKFDTEHYLKILKNICYNYHVAFSVNQITGGYFHEDGTYVEENSLALTLIGIEKEIVQEIAKDLCAFFHQESVMAVYEHSDVEFISEQIDLT